MPKKAAVQIRKKEISALSEDKYHIFNYYAKTNERNFELYQIEVEPGCEHASIGHSTNSFEYLMMLKGELVLETDGEAYALKKDDAICFDASGAHSYKNIGKKDAKAVLLIHYR
jgi:transcriptional regulator